MSAGIEKMATATRLDATATFIGIFRIWVKTGIITTPPPTPRSPAVRPETAPTTSEATERVAVRGRRPQHLGIVAGREPRTRLDVGLGAVGVDRRGRRHAGTSRRARTKVETPV